MVLSPLAISGIKEVINYSRDHSVDESLNYVALWNAAMKYEDDLKETFKCKNGKERREVRRLYKERQIFRKIKNSVLTRLLSNRCLRNLYTMLLFLLVNHQKNALTG